MIERTKIPDDILSILNTLKTAGYSSYLVGGCVRDLVLGKSPKDYDICTAATPEIVQGLFPKVIPTGIKHGTVTVLSGDNAVEITTFRSNGERGSAVADVSKRDFTINGLLYDGTEVIDYVGGLQDIKSRTVRAIGHSGARFAEDPLRMLRAVRLACQLGFTVEEKVLKSMAENSFLIRGVSPERIRDELVKILISTSPASGIRLLQETGLLKEILPDLEQCYGFEQRNPHHCKDVFEHTLAVLEKTPAEQNIRLAALLHDIGKPKTFTLDEKGVGHFYLHNVVGYKMAREVLRRLKFDNDTIREVSLLVKEHMNRKFVKRSSIKKLINRVGKEKMNKLLALQEADELGSKTNPNLAAIRSLQEQVRDILEKKEPLTVKDLAVSGKDLMELGIEEGADIGRTLDGLLEKVLTNPELNTRENLLELAAHLRKGKEM